MAEKEDKESRVVRGGAAVPDVSPVDLMAKVDISDELKADLMKELWDKRSKIRGEALQKVGFSSVGMVATHCVVMCGLSVYALRCALLLVSLVFGELFFGESPSLHDLFCTFWQSAFSVTCFGCFFGKWNVYV